MRNGLVFVMKKTKKCNAIDCCRNSVALGLCLMHYKRKRKHGDENFVFKYTNQKNNKCSVDGCNKKVVAVKMCVRHYTSLKKYGDAIEVDNRLNRSNEYRKKWGRFFYKKGNTEHRYNLAIHIGRPLLKSEHVHHIDLDKWNNEIDNLYVCDQVKHNKIHHQLQLLAASLYKAGVICFSDGVYFLNKNYEYLLGGNKNQ